MNPSLGSTAAGPLRIDLDELVKTRLLVQANSGAGKSWALRRLLEQTFGRVQHLVIDPEGEFSTLRERHDYVLAAPAGGDTGASPKTAKLLAHRLLELGASAILDIYELKAFERIAFVHRFLDALIDAPKELWHPVLVVIDEAHTFCPQVGSAESYEAVVSLMQRGRKRGFCGILATQRISKLHKDAAAEANNKLIGRSSLDVDMKRAAEELGFTTRDRQLELRQLAAGEFFAFGPALSRDVVRVQVGEVLTTHPRAGGARTFTPPAPTAKIRALLPRLADLPAEAERDEKDLATLRRENADLKRRLTVAEKSDAVKPCTHAAELRDLKEQVRALEMERRQLEKERNGSDSTIAAVRSAVESHFERLTAHLDHLTAPASSRAPSPPRPATPPRATVPREQLTGARAPASVEGLKSGAMRILRELASRHPATWTRPQLGSLTGFAHTGGTFQTYLGELKRRGLVSENGAGLEASDKGLDAVGEIPAAPTSHEDVMAMWKRALKAGCFRMLEALAEASESGLSRDELADAVSMEASGGTFQTYLGILARNGLVRKEGSRVIATDVLWP